MADILQIPLTEHCALCDLKEMDMQQGLTCSLTNKKPAFAQVCPQARFEDNAHYEIRKKEIAYQRTLHDRSHTILAVCLQLLTSFGALGAGYFLWKVIWNSGWISSIPIVIAGSFLVFFPRAVGTWINYRQTVKEVTRKRNELHLILDAYGLHYEAETTFSTDRHGNTEATCDVTLQSF